MWRASRASGNSPLAPEGEALVSNERRGIDAGKKLHGPALKMTRAGYLIPFHFIEDGTST
jgi:hypothetical protein